LTLLVRHLDTHPSEPVMVVALDGWIDAGLGAKAAVANVLEQISTELMATFDPDELIDHRARRPTLRLIDGVIDRVTWPEIELRVGEDANSKAALILVGPEPDMRWHAFTDAVVDLARSLDVRLVVGLGAFPAPVPHTRPTRVAATATSPELAGTVGYVSGTIEVPAGVHAPIEAALGQAGIPAVGIWARVPHYLSGMPYPAAAAALLESLAAVSGLALDSSSLQAAATSTRTRVDALIAQSEEHTAMVRQLEEHVDAAESAAFGGGDIPSGDELAAELERFLRGEL